MQISKINRKVLQEAIAISFYQDKVAFDMYDPNVKVETLNDIVENILFKIGTYPDAIFMGIYDKNKLIGYFVYKEKQLISFALAKEYRTRSYLREFFKVIKTTIKGNFMCLLWAKNIRAIKYLMKNKMEIINQNDKIIQLAI